MSDHHHPTVRRHVKDGCAALKSVGESIRSVEILFDGTVRILTGTPALEVAGEGANEWDEVLPRQ